MQLSVTQDGVAWQRGQEIDYLVWTEIFMTGTCQR